MSDLLITTTATTLVPTCPERTWAEIRGLMAELWSELIEELDARPPELLVHAVGADCTSGVWLTWHLAPAGPGTRVELRLDELDSGAPDPELDRLLLALLANCVTAPVVLP